MGPLWIAVAAGVAAGALAWLSRRGMDEPTQPLPPAVFRVTRAGLRRES
jgi:hypothetical protein